MSNLKKYEEIIYEPVWRRITEDMIWAPYLGKPAVVVDPDGNLFCCKAVTGPYRDFQFIMSLPALPLSMQNAGEDVLAQRAQACAQILGVPHSPSARAAYVRGWEDRLAIALPHPDAGSEKPEGTAVSTDARTDEALVSK